MSHDDLDPRQERALGELLRSAVTGIEPEDRLGELRAAVSRPARRRSSFLAISGAALAGAAAVATVAIGGPALLGADEPDDAPVASAPADDGSTDPSPTPSQAPVATRAVAGYYLGETPAGVRLYREFRSVESGDFGPAASLRLLTSEPADPDYRTAWPSGAFAGAEVDDDKIIVELADTGLEARPAAMSEAEAEASVQQVVYTLQAYAQQRLPVEFTTADGAAPEVLGTTAGGPVAASPQLQVLSLVNLTSPDEGQRASDQLRVEGVASSPEGTVPWRLEDGDGRSVADGFFTARGAGGERLSRFEDTIDLAGVAPGTYALVVETEDASGGSEGLGPFSDTRTVVVE